MGGLFVWRLCRSMSGFGGGRPLDMRWGVSLGEAPPVAVISKKGLCRFLSFGALGGVRVFLPGSRVAGAGRAFCGFLLGRR